MKWQAFFPKAIQHGLMSCLVCFFSGPIVFNLLNIGDFKKDEVILVLSIGSLLAFFVSFLHTLFFTVPVFLLFQKRFLERSLWEVLLIIFPLHLTSVLLGMYLIEDGWFSHRDGHLFVASVAINAELVLVLFCYRLMRALKAVAQAEELVDQIGST
ncbi:MAG: hypothetical protein AAF206_12080 [Bacteroidota bacterium]